MCPGRAGERTQDHIVCHLLSLTFLLSHSGSLNRVSNLTLPDYCHKYFLANPSGQAFDDVVLIVSQFAKRSTF